MTKPDYAAKWAADATKVLVGRTIASVRYTNDQEITALDWYERGLVIIFDNGDALIVSRDDEGNGPGALFTTFDALPTIPVVPR